MSYGIEYTLGLAGRPVAEALCQMVVQVEAQNNQ